MRMPYPVFAALDREWPAFVRRHPHLGIDDVYDVWRSDPLFYPAKPPAHWLERIASR